MSTNNIEGMKKIIEAKRKQSSTQGMTDEKPNSKKISNGKAFKTRKQGGCFDK